MEQHSWISINSLLPKIFYSLNNSLNSINFNDQFWASYTMEISTLGWVFVMTQLRNKDIFCLYFYLDMKWIEYQDANSWSNIFILLTN